MRTVPIERQMVAAGRFYPANKDSLIKDVSALFENCKRTENSRIVRAIISPHAGYVYSGRTAASAYSTVSVDQKIENIFVIGSSHVMSFDGASVYNSGDFVTPMGIVKVNREIGDTLIKNNMVFGFTTEAHFREHSIEVQLPIIQYYFKDKAQIIPVIIGTDDPDKIREIAYALKPWFTNENLFVISSDFSHYPSYADAVETDLSTALGLATGDPDKFLKTLKENKSKLIKGLATSMCGWTSGLTLLYLSEGNINLHLKLIDYSNSGDSQPANKNEVVGYYAIAMYDESNIPTTDKSPAENLSFNVEEKKELFALARNSIRSMLYDKQRPYIDVNTIPAKLKSVLGAFVTLKIDGKLRGCIGRFMSDAPLHEVIVNSAISSAFDDPRFLPVSKEEFDRAEIEITVIGPMKKIKDINEIKLGKHGIYIKKDLNSGTMLPQVATENGWNVEQFLGFTSRDKAGLGWDGWKDSEIFIYVGLVLEENIERKGL